MADPETQPVATPTPVAFPRRRLLLCALLLLSLVLPLVLGAQAREVPSIGRFVGRFHMVLLHVPIVLLAIVLCLEVFRQPLFSWFLPEASPVVIQFLLSLGALGAWAAAMCGWLLAMEGGYAGELLARHFYLGLATAAVALLSLMLRLWCDARPNWKARLAYAIALPTSTAVVIMASHLGGSLTHGEGFLTEHAPPVLRRMLGLPETATAAAPGAADRTFYEASIQPILTSRCVACHGPEKAKGKLRLDSYAELVKGGNYGPSVVPGKPDTSELLRRVRLPLDDDERMPPKGKPQLTPGEEAVLAWWIEAGASGTATAAALNPPPAIRSQLGR